LRQGTGGEKEWEGRRKRGGEGGERNVPHFFLQLNHCMKIYSLEYTASVKMV